MPNFLGQKNVLIIPLSSFICFNKKMAGEKLANLFGKSVDDRFSCDEEIQDYEKFCGNLLQKILTSQIAADFNLGKKTKHEFISELLSFLSLPSNKSSAIEAAWNALIEFDRESSEAFNALIKLTLQGKSIYFIGNTNELHAKKILDLFAGYPHDKLSFWENLPEEVHASPLAVSQVSYAELGDDDLAAQMGTIYFCLSYAYKTLLEQPQSFLTRLFTAKSASGLLAHLKISLNELGKTQDDILLINPYEKTHAITKKLALETISKENFYTDLLAISTGTAATTLSDPKLVEAHIPTNIAAHEDAATFPVIECSTATPSAKPHFTLSTHNCASSRRVFFSRAPKNEDLENSETSARESTPLLRQ